MEKQQIKISVIIPVYNGGKWLAQCIEIMRNQSHKNMEIIVIDDGSADDSLEVAKNYPVRIIAFEKNRGAAAARNAGIDAATGEYLHFMDVDDLINEEFYERMVAAALEADADVACCGMVNEPKPHRTTLYTEQRVLTSVEDKMRATNVGRWGICWRYLFRVSFLRTHGIRFEEGRIIEDMPFSLQAIYFANKVVLVPGTVYTYILHETSVMHRPDRFGLRLWPRYRPHPATHRTPVATVP